MGAFVAQKVVKLLAQRPEGFGRPRVGVLGLTFKENVADLRNSSGSRLGGTILGAAFIDASVEPDTQWAHLDIASTAWYEEDRPFSPKGPQGAAVRTLVELAATVAKGS